MATNRNAGAADPADRRRTGDAGGGELDRPDTEDTAPDPHDGLHVAHELQRDGGPVLPGEARDRSNPPDTDSTDRA